ncbi:hypothetical protein FOA43_002282 [Brettanomyces nanus]|uniref:5'-3' exoribonuclease 1 n=1 Tax=Eeniella nana TaxID=13502 RepID=A0A875S6Z5_EENNA|nr:uncharacterized protein FOA43_002282 [Brettanomyces nanus]QPG74944.1 hypothetical protein FOA43_002282 [Brettanomyces nanus]
MGIPKFFRYISERWPLTSQEVDSQQMIEFDNLYLDMNSILHNCTHTNDGTIIHLSEEQMFGAIFAYIDHLFNTIRPKKVFYMAIDGVAPRAKMNQQRARRFRSAVEAEQNMRKAIERGDPIPKEAPFDSNAITPGTEFMAQVTENLKYYINQKVSHDSNWQNVKVVMSGHEVPGEGEHKIMEYIRVQRAQPGYDPNTRHCVYGLDADLIMLGLASHEPHFALLREEVVFGRNRGQPSSDLTKQKFYLMHISLVREYLELEFQDLEDQLTFDYDFEKVLDDFILIMYVVGNDFLPNLPDLHLNKGAFPLLVETFKEAMRRTDGYLNESGTINMKRLKVWLDILSIFELDNFERGSVDVEWFNSQLDNISQRGAKKRAREGKELLLKQQKKMVGHIKAWVFPLYNQKFSVKEMEEDESKIPSLTLPRDFFDSKVNMKFIKQFAFDAGLVILHSKSKDTYSARIDIDGIDPNETDEDFEKRADDVRTQIKRYQRSVIVDSEEILDDEKDLYNKKFIAWKNQYYKDKLGFTLDDEDKIKDMTENYVEGLQWVLYYYYQGVCSWPWYYRYHYAPRISDVAKGMSVKIDFNKGTPFKPFQQLMGVLPARSKELMPTCYRTLMTDPKSPIIDFYPNDCPIDMNGKTAPWEAVVLLSFVDEKRMIEAMKPYDEKLSPEEKKRNSFGKDLIYSFNPQVKTLVKSPVPEWLPDFESHCIESEFSLPSMDGLKFIQGRCKGSLMGTHALAGFPTLKTIPFSYDLEYAHLVVFQQPSRSVSMILTLKNVYSGLTVEQFAKQYVGQVVYANYPYLREYKIISVTDNDKRYECARSGKSRKVISSPLEGVEHGDNDKNRREIIYQMKVKKGLRFARNEEVLDSKVMDGSNQNGREDENPIKALVYARRVIGLAPTKDGAYVKMLSKEVDCFPRQFIVEDVIHKDKRFEETPPIPIEEAYPIGSNVIFLGSFSYGAPAKVVGYSDGKLALTVTVVAHSHEPDFGSTRAQYEKHALKFHPSNTVAKMLHISPLFLSKITSMYLIYAPGGERREDVGLGLKFQGKQQKVLGFTRKSERYWEYSDLAVATLDDYMKKFPEVFKALRNYHGNSIPESEELFRGVNEDVLKKNLKELKDYLRETKANFIKTSLNSDSLTKFGIGLVEKQIISYSMTVLPVEKKGIKGIPRTAVFDPSKRFLLLRKQFFELGDRVEYALDSGKVSLFSKGTVVGVRSYDSKVLLQVVFDQPVLTGNQFDGRLETQRGLTVDSSALLNLTHGQFVYHADPKTAKAAKVKKQQHQKQKQQEKQKSKKELLGVIKKEENQTNKTEAVEDAGQTKSQPSVSSGSAAVQNIYNSVLGNVLSAGQPAASTVSMTTGATPGYFPPPPPTGALYQDINQPLPVAFHETQPVAENHSEESQKLMNMLNGGGREEDGQAEPEEGVAIEKTQTTMNNELSDTRDMN